MSERQGKRTPKSDVAPQKTAPAGKKRDGNKGSVKNHEAAPSPEQGSWLFEADRSDLISIIKRLPVGIAILGSPFGNALHVNDEILATLGHNLSETPSTTDFLKKTISNPRKRREERKNWKEAVRAGGGVSPDPGKVLCRDGVLRTFERRAVVLRKDLIISMWIEVTEREAIQEELRESEERFRAFFENSADPFLLFNGEGLVDCNGAAQRLFDSESKRPMLGRTLEDLSGKTQSGSGSSRKEASVLFRNTLRRGSHKTEWTVRTLTGRDIPVELSLAMIKLGGENLFFAVLRDITRWKEAEGALLHAKVDLEGAVKERTSELLAVNEKLRTSREELRSLSEHLQRAREDERTRIAREVHDRLGQFLTGLKMNLVYQAQNPPPDPAVQSKQTDAMIAQIDAAILSVKDICSELRPSMLGHFGLTEAIRWYMEDFQKRTGIRCGMRVDSGIPALHEDLAVLVFRIFQEAMTNVLRHARATRVTVTLRCEGNVLTLKVRDNGGGMPAEEVLSPRSFGIIGIRERVRFWGGESDFRGSAGKGTVVTVSLPLRHKRPSGRTWGGDREGTS